MDLLLVALIAGTTYLYGIFIGHRAGKIEGRDEEVVRRRIAELQKTWRVR